MLSINLTSSGLLTYVVLNTLTYLTRVLSRGRILTEDEDNKEYWTYKLAGPLPWFIRAIRNSEAMFSQDSRNGTNGLPRQSISSSVEGGKSGSHDITMIDTSMMERTGLDTSGSVRS